MRISVRSGASLPIALPLLLSAAGCLSTSARFIKTDPGYRTPEVRGAPLGFVDETPDTPFGSVGIIEVQGPVVSVGDAFINLATKKGAEQGCDVLVSQATYENRTTTLRYRRGTAASRPNGVASWLFTCGVFDPHYGGEENEKLASAKVREIVMQEYGEPVCSMQAMTGTHIARNVCSLPGEKARVTVFH